MGLLIGIDEAGYGPLLGPLVVSATVWRVADDADADGDGWRALNLWSRLERGVCKSPQGSAGRLVVGDSKQIYDRKKGIGSLERTVLAFARAAGVFADSLGGFVAAVSEGAGPAGSLMPWYHSLGRALPADRVGGAVGTMAEQLPEFMRDAGIRCVGLLSQIVAEDAYNARVNTTRNKAALLVEQVLRLIVRGLKHGAGGPVAIVVDRLGGRANYRQLLRDAWPERELFELATSDTVSRYRLAAPASSANRDRTGRRAGAGAAAGPPVAAPRDDWWIEFAVDADQDHLPVALASMLSKYVRELLMDEFNAYWLQRVPGLRPTAGYYNDAQRFLTDIEPHVPASGMAVPAFVRAR